MNPSVAHLLAGGIGGTVGAIATCPLEVVKVRLQSSKNTMYTIPSPVNKEFKKSPHSAMPSTFHRPHSSPAFPTVQIDPSSSPRKSLSIVSCLRLVVKEEGMRALFRGIGPTLVGVLPSRAIYFGTYYSAQVHFTSLFGNSESAFVTIFSAAAGGIVTATLTNPIWYIKTRLQLPYETSSSSSALNTWTVIRNTWEQQGWRGFYRGVQASYVGVGETAIHFLLYEKIKRSLVNKKHKPSQANTVDHSSESHQSHSSPPSTRLYQYSDTILCMIASAFSKTVATSVMYPHEVVRTRLREDNIRYQRFVQSFMLIFREEGVRGLYGGLATHYIRQIPNACIMLGVYEAIVFLLNDWNMIRK